jgi:heme exporter protein A
MHTVQTEGPAIRAVDVAKTYGHFPALRNISIEVPAGSFLTLFGANGAGKTTFLKIASTLARPSRGRLEIAGFDVVDAAEQVRRRIGLLSHNTYVYRDLSPIENLRFFARLYGVDPKSGELEDLLKAVGLERRAHDAVRTFSRGLLQRVGLARVMLHRPTVLLLDEPYTGLDARAVDILNGMLDEAVSEGRTVVLTTHDLELGLRAATRVDIMDRGKIVYSGSPSDPGTRDAYRAHIHRDRKE